MSRNSEEVIAIHEAVVRHVAELEAEIASWRVDANRFHAIRRCCSFNRGCFVMVN
jgi:hypothetical protein